MIDIYEPIVIIDVDGKEWEAHISMIREKDVGVEYPKGCKHRRGGGGGRWFHDIWDGAWTGGDFENYARIENRPLKKHPCMRCVGLED